MEPTCGRKFVCKCFSDFFCIGQCFWNLASHGSRKEPKTLLDQDVRIVSFLTYNQEGWYGIHIR